MDFSGGRLVVGAPQGQPLDGNGAVFTFVNDGAPWAEEQKLISPTPDTTCFGCSVAISGDRIAVGADGGFERVYVFELGPADWEMTATLHGDPGTTPGANFGDELALSGDRLVVTAPTPPSGATAGVAYVFDYSGGNWQDRARLYPLLGAPAGPFGSLSVLTDGREVFIGAQAYPVDFLEVGAVLVYSLGDFTRGDVNADASIDISDAIRLLSALFVSGAEPVQCDDAADVNDDGGVDLADAIFTLSSLFLSGATPIPPPNECDIDATSDTLDCDTHAACP